MRLSSLVASGAFVLLAACSINGEAADPRPTYIDAAASAFTSGRGGPALPDELAECVGTALVDLVGAEALRDAGVSGQDMADAADLSSLEVELPRDAVAELTDALGGCDLGAGMEGPLLDAFVAESGGELSVNATTCVLSAADDHAIEAGMAATFIDSSTGTRGFDEVLDGLGACPDAVAEVLVNGFGQQQGQPLSEDEAACIHEHVAANAAAAGATFSQGGPATDAYAQSLIAACFAGSVES